MDFKSLVERNRSYRGYDESFEITRSQLETLIGYARLAPSSINLQPLKYYISYKNDTNSLIQPLTKWARRLMPMVLPHPGHCPTAFIVILVDTEIAPNVDRFAKDIGIVAQTILLGAVDMGLGGCMIGNFNPDEISSALNLSSNMKPVLIIALGKPDEKVVITDAADGSIAYYRDDNDTHYVPKRQLDELIIN